MTRGHRGSLLLRCRAPSSPSPCRFIPAHYNHRQVGDQTLPTFGSAGVDVAVYLIVDVIDTVIVGVHVHLNDTVRVIVPFDDLVDP